MPTFIKIKNNYFNEDHIVAVKRIRSFRDDHGKVISYVVRVTAEAAGDDNPRHANIWCETADVEDFLIKVNMPRTTKWRRDPEPEPEPEPEDLEEVLPCPTQPEAAPSSEG